MRLTKLLTNRKNAIEGEENKTCSHFFRLLAGNKGNGARCRFSDSVFVLFLFAFSLVSVSATPGVGHSQEQLDYYYRNHSHEPTKDYVFRTGRLIPPFPRSAGEASPDASPSDLAETRLAGLDDASMQSLARELIRAGSTMLSLDYTLAISTPVNLHNLYASSSFGRVLAERLLGELQRAGIGVIDVRKTPSLLLDGQVGEFGLSRDIDQLSFVQEAQALLVGTYSVTPERVMVELRILNNNDGRVLSAVRRDFARSPEIMALLADERAPRPSASPISVSQY